MIHVYCQSFSIRITSTRGRMWWKWKRQRISLSITAWWWCLIQVYFMLRTQEIPKCDCIHSIWRYVWLTERIHIDLPWSIIVSGLSILWLGGDALLRSRRRHWTSVWKHSDRWIRSSQSVTDPLTGWRSSWFRTWMLKRNINKYDTKKCIQAVL